MSEPFFSSIRQLSDSRPCWLNTHFPLPDLQFEAQFNGFRVWAWIQLADNSFRMFEYGDGFAYTYIPAILREWLAGPEAVLERFDFPLPRESSKLVPKLILSDLAGLSI